MYGRLNIEISVLHLKPYLVKFKDSESWLRLKTEWLGDRLIVWSPQTYSEKSIECLQRPDLGREYQDVLTCQILGF